MSNFFRTYGWIFFKSSAPMGGGVLSVFWIRKFIFLLSSTFCLIHFVIKQMTSCLFHCKPPYWPEDAESLTTDADKEGVTNHGLSQISCPPPSKSSGSVRQGGTDIEMSWNTLKLTINYAYFKLLFIFANLNKHVPASMSVTFMIYYQSCKKSKFKAIHLAEMFSKFI